MKPSEFVPTDPCECNQGCYHRQYNEEVFQIRSLVTPFKRFISFHNFLHLIFHSSESHPCGGPNDQRKFFNRNISGVKTKALFLRQADIL